MNASCTTRNKTACKANKSVEAYNATKAVGAAKMYNAAKADNPDKPENSPVFPLPLKSSADKRSVFCRI